MEVQNPDFLPAVELEDGAQVKLHDVSVFKEIWHNLLLLLAASHVKSATTVEDVVKVKVKLLSTSATLSGVLALLLLLDSLWTELIVCPSFFRVTQRLVRIGNLLELGLGSLRVIGVLVRVMLDSELLESLLDLRLRGRFLQTHHVVVVIFRLLHFLLRLLLVLSLMMSTAASKVLLPMLLLLLPFLGLHLGHVVSRVREEAHHDDVSE